MMEFVKYLRPEAAEADKALFKSLTDNGRGVFQVMQDFKKNNHMEDADIKVGEFETWLASLGY